MKKVFILIVAVVTFLCTMICSFGEPVDTWQSMGFPETGETIVLKQQEWDGKTRLKANTCYFVNSRVAVTSNNTLPENSMLVVENGGKLVIGSQAALYIRGVVAVHSNAMLQVNGTLILNSPSVSIINGSAVVNQTGKISVYGKAQISPSGKLQVSGQVKTFNKGTIDNYGKVRRTYDKAFVSACVKHSVKDVPTYYVEELSDYISNTASISGPFDTVLDITDLAEKTKLIRSFEAVLFKYSDDYCFDISEDAGSFHVVPQYTLYFLNKGETKFTYDNFTAFTGMFNGWNGTTVNRTENDYYSEGSFYTAKLGKADIGLFSKVNPESQNFSGKE